MNRSLHSESMDLQETGKEDKCRTCVCCHILFGKDKSSEYKEKYVSPIIDEATPSCHPSACGKSSLIYKQALDSTILSSGFFFGGTYSPGSFGK